MGRRNAASTVAEWNERTKDAPYRASIDGNCHWPINRPDPGIIVHSRISPGGRMLMAFSSKAIRDYFVDGHLDQGAQVEGDGASKATARQGYVDEMTSDVDEVLDASFEEVCKAYDDARRSHQEADARIEAWIRQRLVDLVAAGRVEEAVALRNALPADCFAKTMALQDLRDAMDRTADRYGIAPLEDELALMLTDWQRTRRREQAIYPGIARMAQARAQQMIDEDRREDIPALAEKVRGSFLYAGLLDMMRYGKPTEAPSEGAAPSA